MSHWTHERLKPTTYKEGRDVPLYRERKFDGKRVTFFKQKDGTLVCYGRRAEIHLEMMEDLAAGEGRDWLWAIRDNLPPMSSVDGELWVVGGKCTSVIHHVKEKHPNLSFTPFAIPYWKNEWMGHQPFDQATFYMKEVLGLHPAIRNLFDPVKHTVEKLLVEAKKLEVEGWILKAGQYHDWWKVKVTKTLDAVVIGWKPGTGKYKGMMGSLDLSLWDIAAKDWKQLTNVGTGFNDEERRTIIKSVIGSVVEVEYAEVAANGALFHPRFLRFRDDKKPKECTLDQLEIPNEEEA